MLEAFLRTYLSDTQHQLNDLFGSDYFSVPMDTPSWSHILNKRGEELYGYIEALPDINLNTLTVECGRVHFSGVHPLSEDQIATIKTVLKRFISWRKGPFKIDSLVIDSEWKSDMKWDRISCDFKNKRILDIGCGNGYYLWRCAVEGARAVVGLDPYSLYVYQYLALHRFHCNPAVCFLPFSFHDVVCAKPVMDIVMCMGVLYHLRNPFECLQYIKRCLKPNGHALIETLILDHDEPTCLTPTGRYANMKNVWFIPSRKTLTYWIKKAGFRSVECTDISMTTQTEQRVSSDN